MKKLSNRGFLVGGGGGGPITASDITDASSSGVTVLTGTPAEGRSALGIATDAGGSQPAGYYVDSVNGNDTNSGRTSAAPLKTLTALMALGVADGSRIYLARGSVFTDSQLDLHTKNNILVSSYGAGPRPLLDCADDMNASWTQYTTDGSTHTWYRSITVGTGAFEQTGVWDNLASGAVLSRLVLKTSIAEVEATAGSCYYSGGILYVHVFSGVAPTAGQVSVAIRDRAIWLGDGALVEDVDARRNLHNDGSIVVGRGSLVRRCKLTDGSKHHMLIGSGRVEDVEFSGALIGGIGSHSAIAFYFNNGADGEIAEIVRCSYAYALCVDGVTYGAAANTGGILAMHNGGTGYYGSLMADACILYNCNGFVMSHTGSSQTIKNCLFVDTAIAIIPPRDGVGIYTDNVFEWTGKITSPSYAGLTGYALQYASNSTLQCIGDVINGRIASAGSSTGFYSFNGSNDTESSGINLSISGCQCNAAGGPVLYYNTVCADNTISFNGATVSGERGHSVIGTGTFNYTGNDNHYLDSLIFSHGAVSSASTVEWGLFTTENNVRITPGRITDAVSVSSLGSNLVGTDYVSFSNAAVRVVGGKKYKYRAIIYCNPSNGGGIKIKLNAGSAAISSGSIMYTMRRNGTINSGFQTSLSSEYTFNDSNSGNGALEVEGVLVISGSGLFTIYPSMGQVAAVGTTYLNANCYFEAKAIT